MLVVHTRKVNAMQLTDHQQFWMAQYIMWHRSLHLATGMIGTGVLWLSLFKYPQMGATK